MDIRRIPLWEGRNATYMSNDIINVVIEDQGEVCLELSNTCISGARVNPLSLPYSNVYNTYMPQIVFGLAQDPEAFVAEFRSQLQAAGIENVMAEVQRQIDAVYGDAAAETTETTEETAA